jgi:hypothetical protein
VENFIIDFIITLLVIPKQHILNARVLQMAARNIDVTCELECEYSRFVCQERGR